MIVLRCSETSPEDYSMKRFNDMFIGSVFSDPEALAMNRAQGRTRKIEARMLSVFVHAAFLSLACFMIHQADKALPPDGKLVFLNNPIMLPFDLNVGDGGGGGGGGRNQPAPAATGSLPAASRIQLMPPDQENPQPLLSAEDLVALLPTIQMPIDIPRDIALATGVMGPPNGSTSSGPGNGGGIGDGEGPGAGPGKGPGAGLGSPGGIGGGPGDGIGHDVYVVGSGGVKPPVPLVQPLPAYTEEARKVRAEGIVLVRAIIRKDGTVDSFNILRGLGYGLDESAIKTIASKWRFKPGTLDGKAVDVQANIEVAFRLY
jgi:TonB family protein